MHSNLQDVSGLAVGPGGPLHIGAPPAHPHQPFMGILSGEPSREALRRLVAGLLLEAGQKGEPLLVLVMQGKPAVTLHGGWACFEKAGPAV